MLTNDILIWLVPAIFILDLFLTICVKLKKLADINLVALVRFVTLVLGSISTWLLFFDAPSQGILYDYLLGLVLLYYIPVRLIFIR
ncbi:hypothetical protein CWB63_16995 [Pseudoalteromonas sp. S409]|nr:hypothetical protein ATS71_10885 [Pseudoalteromonas sp. H71]TMN79392.1 hypothetical protein CWB64_14970 [Pseudoalteromonas sp. S410]TMN87296.1 hypothetical protein CWB62_18435 [Pseudoalteromonas sp. S408]TMN94664.1 hypothetical protein CWB61_17520 [Pseudoalteromonas sp. S407]TMN95959.1 hypothetical protein CWB63_16995 [Pseudoalteromonas sp. S409]TMO06580.1 hypothetical protein CWB57_17580 [Pseudoalteromonas sp. S186]TMO15670.1 hypothetical protein CWB56_09685 [Pseudoalteromonas sp. S185]